MAALACGLDWTSARKVLAAVYDLGGGLSTFRSCACVEGIFEVLGHQRRQRTWAATTSTTLLDEHRAGRNPE